MTDLLYSETLLDSVLSLSLTMMTKQCHHRIWCEKVRMKEDVLLGTSLASVTHVQHTAG